MQRWITSPVYRCSVTLWSYMNPQCKHVTINCGTTEPTMQTRNYKLRNCWWVTHLLKPNICKNVWLYWKVEYFAWFLSSAFSLSPYLTICLISQFVSCSLFLTIQQLWSFTVESSHFQQCHFISESIVSNMSQQTIKYIFHRYDESLRKRKKKNSEEVFTVKHMQIHIERFVLLQLTVIAAFIARMPFSVSSTNYLNTVLSIEMLYCVLLSWFKGIFYTSKLQTGGRVYVSRVFEGPRKTAGSVRAAGSLWTQWSRWSKKDNLGVPSRGSTCKY